MSAADGPEKGLSLGGKSATGLGAIIKLGFKW